MQRTSKKRRVETRMPEILTFSRDQCAPQLRLDSNDTRLSLHRDTAVPVAVDEAALGFI